MTDRIAERTAVDHFLNARRLSVYPRLMLSVMIVVLSGNVLLGSGWTGAVGQIIGSDFITLYASGLAWRQDPTDLYDLGDQAAIQQSLLEPTRLPGLNPYISPPYVAMAYSGLTHLPLVAAFAFWQVLTIGAVIGSAGMLAHRIAASEAGRRGPGRAQLTVLTLSCFGFIEGFVVGQNHGLTLLLVTSAVVLCLRDRDLLAGLCAGLLIYKPQYAAGLLLVWLLWGRYRSLLGFAATAGMWLGWSLLVGGIEPLVTYVALGDQLLGLPYTAGFPAHLLVTPYGLLATVLGESWMGATWLLTRMWAVVITCGLGAAAWRSRRGGMDRRSRILAAALLYPLVASPYTLLHDLVLLVPVFVLLSGNRASDRALTYLAAASYVGMLVLTLMGQVAGIALVALIPSTIVALQLRRIWQGPDPEGTPTVSVG